METAGEEDSLESMILRSVQEAVIATDLTGSVIYWNKGAEKLYQWSRDEVLGKSITDITPTDMSESSAISIMESLSKGEMWTGDFMVKKKDGTQFKALVSNRPMYSSDGELKGIVGTSVDMSGEVMRNQFAVSLIAHELRAPVAGIVGMLQTMIQEEKANDDIKSLMDNSDNLLGFINSLIKIPKKSSGVEEMCNVANKMRESLKSIEPLGARDGITISLKAENLPSLANVNMLVIQRTIFNLVSNAFKYTKRNSVIHVTAEVKCSSCDGFKSCTVFPASYTVPPDQNYLVLKVRDHGKGISKIEEEILFVNGQMLDNKAETGSQAAVLGGSSGIGLYHCRKALQDVGGNMWLSWSRVDEGSEFSAVLPIDEVVGMDKCENNDEKSVDITSISHRQSSASLLSGNTDSEGDESSEMLQVKRTLEELSQTSQVVVADDDKVCRKIATRLLEPLVKVESCRSGRETLDLVLARAATDTPIRIIFLDLQMPDMDGFECVKEIRNVVGDICMPILCALTSSAASEVIDECVDAGFNFVETKPLTSTRLFVLLSQCIVLMHDLHGNEIKMKE